MRLKKGVRLLGVRSETNTALILIASQESRIRFIRDVEFVITSIRDGIHSRTSLHNVGFAIDIRTSNLKQPKDVTQKLKAILSAEFDVILEGNHIHIEYQPKAIK